MSTSMRRLLTLMSAPTTFVFESAAKARLP